MERRSPSRPEPFTAARSEPIRTASSAGAPTPADGRRRPPAVDGSGGTATAIAAGATFSCAIQAGTQSVFCWGTSGGATPPAAVTAPAGAALAIAAGNNFACAIEDGTGAVVCWGGMTPPRRGERDERTATAIGGRRALACAMQAGTGTVVCWNDGLPRSASRSRSSEPRSSSNGVGGHATAIAVGDGHRPRSPRRQPARTALAMLRCSGCGSRDRAPPAGQSSWESSTSSSLKCVRANWTTSSANIGAFADYQLHLRTAMSH
jgi:hypothetical protein